MFKFIDKKIILIVVALSILIFLAITATQQGGMELKKTALDKHKLKVKALKKEAEALSDEELLINKGYFKQECKTPVKETEENLEDFKSEKLMRAVGRSYKLLYDCYLLSADYENAEKNLKEISKIEPQSAKWHGELATTLMKAGKFGMAKRYAHLASQLSPNNSKWYELEGDALAKYNKKYEAIKLYKKAMQYADIEAADRLAKKIDILSYSSRKRNVSEYSETLTLQLG